LKLLNKTVTHAIRSNQQWRQFASSVR